MTGSLFSSAGPDPAGVEVAREELRRRLPELRKLPGFPVGSDDDILAMSVPPYYMACPNPYLREWLDQVTADRQDSKVSPDPGPFASDVSVGKGNPFYKAHSFPTKVPHPAIMRFLLHYTRPGDVVLDGFAGTGMTGVAAQICGGPDAQLRAEIEAEMGKVEWGFRYAVLQDLSPWATFISAGLNLPINGDGWRGRAEQILAEFDQEWGWMYETTHSDGRRVPIDYTVWSEVLTCPICAGAVVFYDVAFNVRTGRVADTFNCPSCGARLTKDTAARRKARIRTLAGDIIERIEFRPTRIHYRLGRSKCDKAPDAQDLEVLQRVGALGLAGEVPTDPLPLTEMVHGSRLGPKGFTHVHHLWPDRSLAALSVLWQKATGETDPLFRTGLMFWVEQALWGLSWMNGYEALQFGRPGGSQVNRYKKGFYYVPSLVSECSPRYNLEGTSPKVGKLKNLAKMWSGSPAEGGRVVISTGSSTRVDLPDESVDYVFVDPPFGENIPYSDLGIVAESWYGVREAVAEEATVDNCKDRALPEYQDLIRRCFRELFRVLKPGRWMTVEFSNSSSEVWLAIQEALSQAGLVVADTRVFDKQQGSFRQVTATNVVKRDIVISAYRPSSVVEERFALVAGSVEGAWEFVREHLSHLPVSEGSRGEARVVRERMGDRLYDRMVAYHVHRGVTVPLTAGEFYAGLEQRFPVRDDMYFLSEQVEAYERHRMTVRELAQTQWFITNEQSAVQWLRQLLKRKPRTYAEIHPLFMTELQAGLPDWEALPELRDLLEGSFLQDGQDRWYVPDPKKTEDLERLRTRALLREFQAYVEGRGRLERFRSEAVRAGFKDAWGRRDFATIVTVGKRLPEDAFVEDEALLYYYDNARRLTDKA